MRCTAELDGAHTLNKTSTRRLLSRGIALLVDIVKLQCRAGLTRRGYQVLPNSRSWWPSMNKLEQRLDTACINWLDILVWDISIWWTVSVTQTAATWWNACQHVSLNLRNTYESFEVPSILWVVIIIIPHLDTRHLKARSDFDEMKFYEWVPPQSAAATITPINVAPKLIK